MKTIKEILDFTWDERRELQIKLWNSEYKDYIERMVIEGKIEALNRVFNECEYEGYERYCEIIINSDYDTTYIYTPYSNGSHVPIEKGKEVLVAKALLPKGKGIIYVPEGYEVTDTEEVRLMGMSKLILYLSKLPEPFKWPEHLPDGTRLEGDNNWMIAFPNRSWVTLKAYNIIARPEDRIEIPDWLEKEPRTIVKGEG